MGAQAEGVLKSGDLDYAADGAQSIYDYLRKQLEQREAATDVK
jgi:hypothetical protein